MTEDSSSSIRKNVNIYWIGATGLAVWFLFLYAPPILWERKAWTDVPFMLHLIGAYSIYLACIFNTLITPSVTMSLHIWVGRCGMILGLVGFVSGIYICYWPWRNNLPSLDFSMGITIGGVAQVSLQYFGYIKIKRFQKIREKLTSAPSESTPSVNSSSSSSEESANLLSSPVSSQDYRDQLEEEKRMALQEHISCMISLFVIACGVPAAMRIVGMFDQNFTLVVLVVVFACFSTMFQREILKRIH